VDDGVGRTEMIDKLPGDAGAARLPIEREDADSCRALLCPDPAGEKDSCTKKAHRDESHGWTAQTTCDRPDQRTNRLGV
jgi:hypothetical protein